MMIVHTTFNFNQGLGFLQRVSFISYGFNCTYFQFITYIFFLILYYLNFITKISSVNFLSIFKVFEFEFELELGDLDKHKHKHNELKLIVASIEDI